MVNLQHSFKMNEETLGISEKESEDLRGMFVHTNPVLLYTTVAVSAVHLLFDVLAFKSDVSFWSSVDSMEGLSSRTLVLNELMEGGVVRLVLDMGETSYVNSSALAVLVSCAEKLREREGGIALAQVSSRVKVPFEMLGLLVFFKFFDTVDAAKAAFPG